METSSRLQAPIEERPNVAFSSASMSHVGPPASTITPNTNTTYDYMHRDNPTAINIAPTAAGFQSHFFPQSSELPASDPRILTMSGSGELYTSQLYSEPQFRAEPSDPRLQTSQFAANPVPDYRPREHEPYPNYPQDPLYANLNREDSSSRGPPPYSRPPNTQDSYRSQSLAAVESRKAWKLKRKQLRKEARYASSRDLPLDRSVDERASYHGSYHGSSSTYPSSSPGRYKDLGRSSEKNYSSTSPKKNSGAITKVTSAASSTTSRPASEINTNNSTSSVQSNSISPPQSTQPASEPMLVDEFPNESPLDSNINTSKLSINENVYSPPPMVHLEVQVEVPDQNVLSSFLELHNLQVFCPPTLLATPGVISTQELFQTRILPPSGLLRNLNPRPLAPQPTITQQPTITPQQAITQQPTITPQQATTQQPTTPTHLPISTRISQPRTVNPVPQTQNNIQTNDFDPSDIGEIDECVPELVSRRLKRKRDEITPASEKSSPRNSMVEPEIEHEESPASQSTGDQANVAEEFAENVPITFDDRLAFLGAENLYTVPNKPEHIKIGIIIKNKYRAEELYDGFKMMGIDTVVIEDLHLESQFSHLIVDEETANMPSTIWAIVLGAWRMSQEWGFTSIALRRLANEKLAGGYRVSHLLFKDQTFYISKEIAGKRRKAIKKMLISAGARRGNGKSKVVWLLEPPEGEDRRRFWTPSDPSDLFPPFNTATV